MEPVWEVGVAATVQNTKKKTKNYKCDEKLKGEYD